MNGRKFLLDTNVLIGLFEGRSEARDLAKRNGLKLEQCAVSQITRLELLGFAGLTPDKEADLKALLTKIAVLAIDPQV